MTYEELLTEVASMIYGVIDTETLQKPYSILREVITLHQPKVESDLNDYLLCEECTEISWRNEKWPCQTIEVILEVMSWATPKSSTTTP